jgi:hypothetical protein
MAIDFVGMFQFPPEVAKILSENENKIIVGVIILYTIGAYSGLEVGISSLDLFKRHRGLYFVSMQIASWGVVLDAIPSLVLFVVAAPQTKLGLTITAAIGWGCMVNAQHFVLYSRLHLILPDITRFRWIIWVIIINGVAVFVTMVTLTFGSGLGNDNFRFAIPIFTRTQVFMLQVPELIICTIYIREVRRALGPIIAIRGKEGRNVITHLIIINMILIFLSGVDIVTTVTVPTLADPSRTVLYGLKLKLEYAILKNLRSFLSSRTPCVFHRGGNGPRNGRDLEDAQSTDYRRRSSQLNVHAMLNSHNWPSYELVPSMPTPTLDALHTFESDPFASCFQSSMANSESRRKRQRDSLMGSTPDFHEVIRQTSIENMNLPASPAPTVVSFTSPGSPRSEHRFSTGGNTRGRTGSSETRSTIEAELLVAPK